jgi:LysM repeat protein
MSTLRNTSETSRTDAPRTAARLATVVGTTALVAATATATAHAGTGASTSGSSLSARAGTPAAAERAVGQDLGAAAPKTYTVRSGDRLSGIAKRFGLSWQQLCEQNGLRDCNYIVPGQELTLSGGSGGSGSGGGGGDEARTQDRASRSGARSVSLPAVAACIREKESGGNYQAENPSTSASGAYQFVDSTWTSVTGLAPPASDYSKATQDRAFAELWDGGAGAHHWVTADECGA